MKSKNRLMQFICYLILIVGGLFTLFPFIWMVLTSLKTHPETLDVTGKVFPSSPQWHNYVEAFKAAPFVTYFTNSVIVALASTVFVCITTVLAAFAFSKYNFKGKKIIFTLLTATLMVPGELMIITNFSTISNLGLYNTLIAIFIPYTASVFYIFLVQQFFNGVPNELYLSAKIDGCSDLKYLIKILVPIAKPIIITICLLNIIASWNAFLWPLLVTNSEAIRTLPIGLIQFQTADAGTQYNLLMAASTMIIVPMLIMFIFTRKYIISGLTQGAIKG